MSTQPEIKKCFFDTEFYDAQGDGFGVEFISLGVVNENDDEYYGVHDNFDYGECASSPWLCQNVLNKLPDPKNWVDLDAIRRGFLDVVEPCDEIQFWARNGTYDFYILCRLFGGYQGLHDTLYKEKGITKIEFCDTNHLRKELGYPKTPELAEADKHDAIVDARHEKVEYDFMIDLKNKPSNPKPSGSTPTPSP